MLSVDYAFQPIVNIHTGMVYGYEALIRNVDHAGFSSITAFFDTFYRQGLLSELHQLLLIKALAKFDKLPWSDEVKLFYNMDGRLLGERCSLSCDTLKLPADLLHRKDRICLEISEKHEICNPNLLIKNIHSFRMKGCKIVLDDFDTGFSGNHALYLTKPEFVKIDRFYIANIEADAQKRMLAASMVNIAHLLGCLVVAEGVETEKEYYCCKNIGCDLIQGYLVQKPQLEIASLGKHCATVLRLSEQDRRKPNESDKSLLQSEIEHIEPIRVDSEPIAILAAFKKSRKNTFFPVISRNREALGIIREETMKGYAYSEYGRYLLANPTNRNSVDNFITRVPMIDIHTPVERLLDAFTSNDDVDGIIITDCLKYVGILRAQSLLRILNEKRIANAIDQNPLSNLPGNKRIYEYLSRALQDDNDSYIIVYFDFDNFKVYNDHYGFRQGDRVILLFAELLKAWGQFDQRFVGHIGGDDFFMGVKGEGVAVVIQEVEKIGKKFSSSAESFYDPETIQRGCIEGKDREGRLKCFPLMSISAAIMELPIDSNRMYTPEEIGKAMAEMKKRAKQAPNKICASTLRHFKRRDTRNSEVLNRLPFDLPRSSIQYLPQNPCDFLP